MDVNMDVNMAFQCAETLTCKAARLLALPKSLCSGMQLLVVQFFFFLGGFTHPDWPRTCGNSSALGAACMAILMRSSDVLRISLMDSATFLLDFDNQTALRIYCGKVLPKSIHTL